MHRAHSFAAATVLLAMAPWTAAVAQVGSTTTSPIVNVNAGLCLGVKGSSTASGALIQGQSCNGSAFQNWTFVVDAAGYYTLQNVGSGLCLDVPGASKTAGQNLQQWGCGGSDNQKWNVSSQGQGQFAVISKASGLATDVFGASTANGSRIVQSVWTAAASQRWTVNAAPSASNRAVGFGRNVTGGAGGTRVRVRTPADLEKALCDTSNAGTCTDTTRRIIEVEGVIDYTGSQGNASGIGCYVASCPAPMQSERILDANMSAQCSGKQPMTITYDKVGALPMLVGANKTVIGIGAKSGIKGRGLRLRGGASNIIIRNLAISDINPGVVWGGDAITLDDVDGVWIDHNYFARIGRQMIVAGWGKAANVTISNNEFDGRTQFSATCNGAHYWNLLLIGAKDSLTLTGNWLHHFSGRAPKIGTEAATSTVQVVNNLFENGPGHALATAHPAQVLVEGNYFGSVDTPIQRDAKSGSVFGVLGTPTAAHNASCSAALKRNCVGNVVTPTQSTNAFTQDASVMEAFKAVPAASLVQPYPAADVPAKVRAAAGPKADVTQ